MQGDCYRRTHLVTRNTGTARLLTRNTHLTTHSTRLRTRSTRLSTHFTRFSIRLPIRGTRLSICPFISSTSLSTRSIRLSTSNTRSMYRSSVGLFITDQIKLRKSVLAISKFSFFNYASPLVPFHHSVYHRNFFSFNQ